MYVDCLLSNVYFVRKIIESFSKRSNLFSHTFQFQKYLEFFGRKKLLLIWVTYLKSTKFFRNKKEVWFYAFQSSKKIGSAALFFFLLLLRFLFFLDPACDKSKDHVETFPINRHLVFLFDLFHLQNSVKSKRLPRPKLRFLFSSSLHVMTSQGNYVASRRALDIISSEICLLNLVNKMYF